MSSTYDVQQYLLDRANIHDIVTKVPFYYDTGKAENLANDVFSKDVLVDYTRILGGEPFTVAGTEWAKQVGKMIDVFDSTQHITTGLLINLPQPGSGPRPDVATVDAQGRGNMVRASVEGGPLVQNGGLVHVGLSKDAELEKQGVNPWRITKYVVIPKWVSGNPAVLDAAKA
ncbi:hypothetical protein GQ53DRAFT_816579 [Thozetella sp. PMI_491]|nr:hypothetical protein GQ53DRAFT_816579 [Thozetella sp. PMI_491]